MKHGARFVAADSQQVTVRNSNTKWPRSWPNREGRRWSRSFVTDKPLTRYGACRRYRSKSLWRVFFDRHGCLYCRSKERIHGGCGMPARCYPRIPNEKQANHPGTDGRGHSMRVIHKNLATGRDRTMEAYAPAVQSAGGNAMRQKLGAGRANSTATSGGPVSLFAT